MPTAGMFKATCVIDLVTPCKIPAKREAKEGEQIDGQDLHRIGWASEDVLTSSPVAAIRARPCRDIDRDST